MNSVFKSQMVILNLGRANVLLHMLQTSLRLSDELLQSVFKHLNIQDSACCLMVSDDWRRLLVHPCNLRRIYQNEIRSAGWIDGYLIDMINQVSSEEFPPTVFTSSNGEYIMHRLCEMSEYMQDKLPHAYEIQTRRSRDRTTIENLSISLTGINGLATAVALYGTLGLEIPCTVSYAVPPPDRLRLEIFDGVVTTYVVIDDHTVWNQVHGLNNTISYFPVVIYSVYSTTLDDITGENNGPGSLVDMMRLDLQAVIENMTGTQKLFILVIGCHWNPMDCLHLLWREMTMDVRRVLGGSSTHWCLFCIDDIHMESVARLLTFIVRWI